MKTLSVLIILSALILVSCSKDDEAESVSTKNSNYALFFQTTSVSNELKIRAYYILPEIPDQIPEVTINGEKMEIEIDEGVVGYIDFEPTTTFNCSVKQYGGTESFTFNVPDLISNVSLNGENVSNFDTEGITNLCFSSTNSLTWESSGDDYCSYDFYIRQSYTSGDYEIINMKEDHVNDFQYNQADGCEINYIRGNIIAHKGVDFTQSEVGPNYKSDIGNGYVYADLAYYFLIEGSVTLKAANTSSDQKEKIAKVKAFLKKQDY